MMSCFELSKAQNPSWRLWAEGLPTGVYPRMVVAPNHDIFYSLLGAGTNLGLVLKANTQSVNGQFTPLPKIPRPSSIQNNIVALGYNKNSEAIVGIYRTDLSQPWLFKFNHQSNLWDTAKSPIVPTLGGHCIATASNGTIYVGTRWAYIYKSTDDGLSYEVLDESKSISSNYPCYYPSALNGSGSDGAIFTLAIDRKGRVYAGTETAGVIYSDDEGKTWHPADLNACKSSDPTQKDTTSIFYPLSISGNAAGIGFTKENALIWSGVNMWSIGWKNKMGFADLSNNSVKELIGLPDYLVQTGQQVSKIVTTLNGQIFYHSGSSTGATQIGIYTSFDGIHWKLFNDGITGQNDGTSQGSLAVDGNKVFMATRDGKVWIFEDSLLTQTKPLIFAKDQANLKISPHPVYHTLQIELDPTYTGNVYKILIYDVWGQELKSFQNEQDSNIKVDVSGLQSGSYFLKVVGKDQSSFNSIFIKI